MTGDVGAEVAAVLADASIASLVPGSTARWITTGEAAGLIAPLIAAREQAAAAKALRDAAGEVGAALVNEVGSGHTSTYSVRRWLQDRAAALDPEGES